jgi:bifunctional non-homologous end joining protein LigD
MPTKRNAPRELAEYRSKRDFAKTSEPPPGAAATEGRLIYVIQKHDATRLHYDFRLEFDGALKSWPIPKGPSLDPKEKRLAVMTEDHPLDYASFEGVIPKGEYGGGPVIVWDAGTYSPDEEGLVFDDREEAERQMIDGLARGKLSFFLQGQKLRGSFTLVKIGKGGPKDWLFIKHKDRFADSEREVTEEEASVISGLTIADLKAGHLPDRSRGRLVVRPQDAAGSKRAPMPKSIEPMHATLTEHPFSSADWYFEPKMDGVRAVVFIDGDSVRLCSRRGLDTTKSFPGIVKEMAAQTERRMILDGEIVALNEQGVPSFQVIQQRIGLQRPSDIAKMEAEIPVYFYAFDLLYAGGYDLRGSPLADRKTLLRQLLIPTDHIHLLEHFEMDGLAAYEGAVSAGLEGVMAKKRDSAYESRRSRVWLKVKSTNEDDFVIGGYTGGGGTRANTFGALLVGQYKNGKLVYAGNVGTGFNEKTLASLLKRLRELETGKSPFDVMEQGSMRFGRPKSETEIHWVKPELVAVVRFAEWTNDGHLRAPSFLGLRMDKAPEDTHKEETVPPPGEESPRRRSDRARKRAGDPLIDEVLEQIARPVEKMNLVVAADKVSLTNLDKPLWPEWQGERPLTKRDLLVYFARVSPYLLPQMRDRPITLTRYPNGIHESHFYQKHWETKLPRYVEVTTVWSEQFSRDQEYLICNNLPTLLWLGQLADIELHTWYSRISPEPDAQDVPEYKGGGEKAFDASRLNFPDYIVFDLDPYIYSGEEKKGAEPELNRKAFLKTCDVAYWLKELLDGMSLSSFVKTTGKTGLHIYVPILRQFDYGTVRAAAETIGRFLVRAHPRDITMEWSVPKRTGKVFFDHNQNTKGKTLASVYSPRPVPWAGVSVPLRWDELRDVYPSEFTILNTLDRIEQVGGDLWQNILAEKHDLSAMLEAVEG